MATFYLHLDSITIQTARVFHSVLVAMSPFNKLRAMNSMLKFNVNVYFSI